MLSRVARRAAAAVALVVIVVTAAAACVDKETARRAVSPLRMGGPRPDELPIMLNLEPPFRYPADLYTQKVQGNTTLRIFIDTLGTVHPESTVVAESSGYPALDSAAVAGVRELRFTPAKLHGAAMAVPILFPVYFRHPEAQPLPGDTVLQRRAASGRVRVP
jgi:TonB family protein